MHSGSHTLLHTLTHAHTYAHNTHTHKDHLVKTAGLKGVKWLCSLSGPHPSLPLTHSQPRGPQFAMLASFPAEWSRAHLSSAPLGKDFLTALWLKPLCTWASGIYNRSTKQIFMNTKPQSFLKTILWYTYNVITYKHGKRLCITR